MKGADGFDPVILTVATRFYIKLCLGVLFFLRLSTTHHAIFIMDPTRANEKRLTSEKPSLYSTGSNDPPAYSDYLGTTTNGNNDEQLLARLGYKQVRDRPQTSHVGQSLTSSSRSSVASSTNGPQYRTPFRSWASSDRNLPHTVSLSESADRQRQFGHGLLDHACQQLLRVPLLSWSPRIRPQAASIS